MSFLTGKTRLYLDQNVLSPASRLGSELFCKNIVQSVRDLKIESIQKFPVSLSPFSIVEYLGVAIPKFPQQEIDKTIASISTYSNPLEIKSNLYELAKNRLRASGFISTDILKQYVSEQRKYTNVVGHGILDFIEQKHISRGDFPEDVICYLATDQTYSIPLPWEKMQNLGMTYVKDIAGSIRKGQNFSQFKGIFRAYEALSSKGALDILSSDPIERDSIRKDIQGGSKAIRTKATEDLVDSEIVHFATVGYYDGIALRPTICLTQDKREKVMGRIALLKSMLGYIQDTYEKKGEIFPEIMPGAVGIVSKAGIIESLIQTKDI